MKPHDKAFVEQIDFLLKEFRDKNINIRDLMKLIGMAYGDYREFHPEELPELDERNTSQCNTDS